MRRSLFLTAGALLVSCGRTPSTASGPPAPAAEFLISAGDSTFWVGSGRSGVRVRGSPILLARYDGRFYEIYLTDDDRSYPDALFVGERLYKRDIVTGDSALILADTTVARIATAYARAHPDERRLDPDEETAEDPPNSATAELEVLELFGPYASYEYHADVDLENGRPWHMTRRGVVDLRSGRPTTVEELLGRAAGLRVTELGRRAFHAVRDSIRRQRESDSSQSARAFEAFGHLQFDPNSFTIVALGGRPAIRFAVTGRGEGPAGSAVELDAVPVQLGPWWQDIRPALPDSGEGEADLWTRPAYRVLARHDSTEEVARVSIADARREWPLASMGAPIHRIDWLDSPPLDSVQRHALGRAFDEAASYDERAKIARSDPAGRFWLAVDVHRARASRPRRHP
jgi:hypothetical protein